MMRVNSDPGFGAGELLRYVKRLNDCERILMEKNKDESEKKGFVKENLGR